MNDANGWRRHRPVVGIADDHHDVQFIFSAETVAEDRERPRDPWRNAVAGANAHRLAGHHVEAGREVAEPEIEQDGELIAHILRMDVPLRRTDCDAAAEEQGALQADAFPAARQGRGPGTAGGGEDVGCRTTEIGEGALLQPVRPGGIAAGGDQPRRRQLAVRGDHQFEPRRLQLDWPWQAMRSRSV